MTFGGLLFYRNMVDCFGRFEVVLLVGAFLKVKGFGGLKYLAFGDSEFLRTVYLDFKTSKTVVW